MKNLNYFERRDKIFELFGEDFYERYPLSSRVLNRYIRSRIHYGDKESESIKLEYQHSKGLRGLIKSLAYYILCLLNLSLFSFRKNTGGKILVSYSIFLRFEILGKQLKDKYNICTALTKKNVKPIFKSKVSDIIKTDRIMYGRRLQILLPDTATFIGKFIDDEKNFDRKILYSKLNILENVLDREITRLGKLFINKKIKLCISAFDQNYEDTFNILACQKIGIKTKCIAHSFLAGDIESEARTNCLPVLANRLYIWSQEDYDSLKGYEEIEKIKIGGYPKFNKEYIKRMIKEYPQKKIVTFFSGFAVDEEWMEEDLKIRRKLFNKLKEISENKGYEIYVRYHGEDEKDMRKGERGLLKKCHIKISRNPFIKDILQSEMSLGLHSSCLYEAKVMDRKSFLLHSKYDQKFFMKGIKFINIDDIEEKLEEKVDNKPRYDLLMNIDSIINDS